MNIVKKSTIAIVMSLLAFSLFTSNIAKAESNPFASAELVTIVSDHEDGKCGQGKVKDGKKDKCGEGNMKDAKKGKCGEGKCGEGKMKAAKKGKCGEGKCGEGKSTEKSKKCGG